MAYLNEFIYNLDGTKSKFINYLIEYLVSNDFKQVDSSRKSIKNKQFKISNNGCDLVIRSDYKYFSFGGVRSVKIHIRFGENNKYDIYKKASDSKWRTTPNKNCKSEIMFRIYQHHSTGIFDFDNDIKLQKQMMSKLKNWLLIKN